MRNSNSIPVLQSNINWLQAQIDYCNSTTISNLQSYLQGQISENAAMINTAVWNPGNDRVIKTYAYGESYGSMWLTADGAALAFRHVITSSNYVEIVLSVESIWARHVVDGTIVSATRLCSF